jgi:hypothetical protein
MRPYASSVCALTLLVYILQVLEAATGVYPFKAQQHNYMALLEHIVSSTEPPVARAGRYAYATSLALKLLVYALYTQAASSLRPHTLVA